MRKIFTLLLIAIMAIGYSWAAEKTIDFVTDKPFGWDNWNTSYASRTLEYSPIEIAFVGVSKQTSTITDCPVVKGGDLTVYFMTGFENYTITGVELTLKQWGSKSKIVVLNTSDDGKNFTESTSVTVNAASVKLSASELNAKQLKFTFNNTSQVGVASIKITYTEGAEKTATTLSFGSDIDGQTLTMKEGEAKTTAATLSPTIDGATIAYTSSNQAVATISEAGVVNALTEGTTTITAKYAGNDTYKAAEASYTLNVTSAKYASTLVFAEAEINKVFGDKFTQTATLVNAEGAPEFTDKTITYSSSNLKIATVDELTGEVTVKLTEGTATITANYAGDGNHKAATASYTLKVTEKLPDEAIVFSGVTGTYKSFANLQGGYDSNKSPMKFVASDGKEYTWTWENGRITKKNEELQIEKGGTTISSPVEFKDFGGYTVILSYRFGSTNTTFNFVVGKDESTVSAKDGQIGTYTSTVGDDQEFKIVNGSNALYISRIVIIPNAPKMTLKEAAAAKKDGDITISDSGMRVVKQIKRKGADSYLLVVKDADGEAVDKATVAGEPYHISYSNGGETVVTKQEEYGESNWLIVEVKDNDTDYEGMMLKSVKGTLTTAGNLQMLAAGDEYPVVVVGEKAEGEYEPNAYTPVNFMVAAGNNTVQGDDGKEYFFMNPKRGEYVKIVDAVYQNNKFYVPAKEGTINHYGFEGAFAIDDTFQEIPSGLEEGKFYSFEAIVIGVDATDKVAANDNSAVSQLYKVAPVNLVNNPVTAVDGVSVNCEVVGVTYYNVAGVASGKPFDGVNIVVTKYADGGIKTTKELR